MIYLKLSGGLGNQMFQLASAIAIATKKNTSVSIDISQFSEKNSDTHTNREFELGNIFNLGTIEIASKSSFDFLLKKGIASKVKRKILNGSVFYETNLHYQPSIKDLTKLAYIEGYFQSEKYFSEFKEEVLKRFTFTKPIAKKTAEAEKLINNTKAIAVHIRRGDYLNNKHTNDIHGVLPLSYYKKALQHFDLSNHQLFFFSDDIEWVKESFSYLDETKITFVSWNSGDDSWQDMYLMSKCNHFIIANSSFSWWGAWLSINKDKIVICPEKWFSNLKMNTQTKDLIPKDWIRV